jgi:hypothetical protein
MSQGGARNRVCRLEKVEIGQLNLRGLDALQAFVIGKKTRKDLKGTGFWFTLQYYLSVHGCWKRFFIEIFKSTDGKGILTWEFQNAGSRRRGEINGGPMTN